MNQPAQNINGVKTRFRKIQKQMARKLFSVRSSDEEPLTMQMARALLERDRLSDILPYRDFDDEHNFIYLDHGKKPSLGIGIEYYPLMLAGKDTEQQIESIISRCPDNAILQFVAYSTPAVHSFVGEWAESRLARNNNELLRTLTERRANYLIKTANEKSLLPLERLHPRSVSYYLFITLPYEDEVDDSHSLNDWLMRSRDVRDSVLGIMDSIGLAPKIIEKVDLKKLLRYLLNPSHPPADLDKQEIDEIPLANDIVERETMLRVGDTGNLIFSNQKNTTHMSTITVDNYPDELHLYMTGQLTGSMMSGERIAPPFWLYTTVFKINPDKARDSLNMKLGVLNKQCMSDSEWYRGMMSHMFSRRDDTMNLLNTCRADHELVRMYTGINIITDEENLRRDTDFVAALWRKVGFKASAEPYISVPVWLSSLPFNYNPDLDQPTVGLQRAVMAHSYNAACSSHVQGDWRGTHPAGGGPLLVSRKGQVGSIDVFQSNTSYNFIVVATSGAGKSFFAAELVCDILSKGGMVRLIDVGRSYARLCETLDGQNMVFDPNKPVSMNPFWGIESEQDIAEMMPVLKEVVLQMAFPNTNEIPAWEYQAVEQSILNTWRKYTTKMEMHHVYEYLLNHDDSRANDLAFQMEPHSIGRYKEWFNGPRELSFSNDFTIVELEELNVDKELRSIVLSLAVNTITREMYLSDRRKPKLLLIDEAWDLLGDASTGSFIETAYRRIRKYNGSAGVITQSFEDFDRSPAAKAAFDNAPWKFVLMQKSSSLEYAKRTGKLSDDEFLLDLIGSVRPGAGYSEIYIESDDSQGLFRFCVDPHSYFTFSTNPKDITALQNLMEEGKTTLEAIDHLATKQLDEMGLGD